MSLDTYIDLGNKEAVYCHANSPVFTHDPVSVSPCFDGECNANGRP